MQLLVATIFYVIFMSVTTSARSAQDTLLIPVDSPFETQFTNPPTTWTLTEKAGAVEQLKKKWEDFKFRNWLFPPKQPKQLDFFRLRAAELPNFFSVRTLPASAWQKSSNSIIRNGELLSPESANVMSDYLVVEVLEDGGAM